MTLPHTRLARRVRARWLAQRAAHPGRQRFVMIALGVAVALGGLWLSARGVDRKGLASALSGVGWWWVAAAALANAANVLAQSWAWRLGLNGGGVGEEPLRHVAAATWIGKAGNQLLPGRVGELARVGVVRRHSSHEPGQIPRIVGSLVAQRMLAILATVMAVVCSALWLPLPVAVPGGRWGPLLALVAVSAVLLLAWRSGVGGRLTRLVPSRLRGVTDGLARGAGLLRPNLDAARALALHVVALGAQLATMALLLEAFDIETPATAPLMIVALVAIAGAVPSAPGGLGVNQVAIVAPLGASYGVPASSALAFSLGLQATVAVVAVAGGLAALVHQRFHRPATHPGAVAIAA